VVCSNCATENEAGRKFCKECGTALAVSCPNCGTANPADAKFCGECGSSLDGLGLAAHSVVPTVPAAGTVRTPPSAERRLVSVLFADLVGFTTLAEGRDPEETRELLTRYFGLAREVIDRHGGTVEKFIGDAVMAVWGAPVAREDDAERAVRAGLELIAGVKTLGPGIEARAGVLTGEAAVTLGATGEGMVAGDLVNTASRLQSIAPPGSVVVGETTERAANRAIAFEPLGDQQLKGKSAPVPAFRALRVVAEIGGRNRAEGLEAPFVGRDDDFRLLKDLFHATGRDKRPRLVSVMGPAGIGKSRLAWEFSKYTDGLVEDTYWHAGRSPSYGEGVTFWALGEMIRRRAELLEVDDEATTRQKIAETVRRWVPDETQQRWIENALLALLGLGESLPGGRDELFAAWRTFFERIAEHGTTVLLFEDLQWADSGLLDFIDHLFDWTKSLPIFVLTLARPTLLDRRPDWGAGRRNFVSLALDPLPEGPMNQLLEGLVPGLPADIRKTIVARADGVPLYAVETVRMLVAEGKLREEGGVYKPVGDLTSIAIPETLTALIAARLDGLEPAERAVLQAAAVLGQSFSVAALEALSGVNAEELGVMLAGFLRREVLSIEADPRSPERGQYSFVQALIREVAYNQLARNQRKERHLAAARWFESLGDDELAGVLAEHYAAAYRNAPSGPEADALAGQARIALRAAADRAATLGSHAQAVAFLTLALEITQEPAERAPLLERAGREATDATPEAARPLLEQAIDLYRSLGDLHGLARATTGLSIVLHSLYRADEAIPALEQAVLETSTIASEPDAVRMLSELARAYANGRDPRALELVDRVLELAESLELMPIIAEGLINRALVLSYAGRSHEPATLLRGVLPIAETHGLNWSMLRALNNLAVGLLNEDIRESERLIKQATEFSRRTGALGSVIYFRGVAVYPQLLLGMWDEIEDTIRALDDVDPSDVNVLEFLQAKAVYQAFQGDDEGAMATLQSLAPLVAEASLADVMVTQKWVDAQVHAIAGRVESAHRSAAEGMAMRSSGFAFYCAEWAARAGLWRSDAGRARDAVDRLQELRLPGRVPRAIRRQVGAALAALDGRQSEALDGYREALEMWREMDVPVFRGLCLMDMVAVIAPSVPEAAAAADEARSLWTRLGAPPLLARLDELLARWEAHDGDGDESRQTETAGRRSSAVPRSG
jgi:class 3 adenylate cyclase/tetratricopeptide (TPR) repeat protein